MQVISEGQQRRTTLMIFTTVFVLIVLTVAGYLYYNVSIDTVTGALQKGRNLTFLFIVEEDDEPLGSAVVVLSTRNNSVALLDIPAAAGNLLPSVQRSDRFSVIYRQQGWRDYRDMLASLTGMEFDFTLRIKTANLVRVIDLLGGVTVDIPFDVREKADGRYYWLDAGRPRLDGDKLVEYLSFPDRGNFDDQLPAPRMLSFLAATLILLQDLEPDRAIGYGRRIWSWVDTDLDRRSFLSLMSYFVAVGYQEKNFVYQKYLGNERTVQGQKIIFPMYNGELLRERMKWVKRSLASPVKSESLAIEILNGVGRNRLASNTADIYRSYGYEVVQVGNTNASQEQTLVIGFVESDEVAKIAQLINCDNIEYRLEDEGGDIDVRILLGKDFNGRYVIR